MKVSVVTISFNQKDFLKECIESVLSQKGDFELEYIVVDPGSTDGSRDLIDSYGELIHRIYEKDAGPADGLNKGFSIATGEIYFFLNSDDILLPGAISLACEKFSENNHCDVLSFNGYEIDRSGIHKKVLLSNKFDVYSYVYGMCVLLQQSTFFRREVFLKVSGFNTENRVSWDGELWFDMAREGAVFMKFSDCISGFRIYENSITGSGAFLDKAEAVLRRHRQDIGLPEQIGFFKRIYYWTRVRFFDVDFWRSKSGFLR